jgi:hypothetical protein
VSDKDSIPQGYAGAEERVRGNFAVASDHGPALNLNEWADLSAISDGTAVKRYQVRVMNYHARAQDYVIRYHQIGFTLSPDGNSTTAKT